VVRLGCGGGLGGFSKDPWQASRKARYCIALCGSAWVDHAQGRGDAVVVKDRGRVADRSGRSSLMR
jgi:hypothetical protein